MWEITAVSVLGVLALATPILAIIALLAHQRARAATVALSAEKAHNHNYLVIVNADHQRQMRSARIEQSAAVDLVKRSARAQFTLLKDKAAEDQKVAVAEVTEVLERKHRLENVATARLLTARQAEADKAKEAQRVAQTLQELAATATARLKGGKWEHATVPLEQIIAIGQIRQDRAVEASGHYHLGRAYFKLTDVVRAEILLKRAQQLALEGAFPKGDPMPGQIATLLQEVERRLLVVRVDRLIADGQAAMQVNPEYALSVLQNAAKMAEENDLCLEYIQAVNASFRAYLLVDKPELGFKALQTAHAKALEVYGEEHKLTQSLATNVHMLECKIKAREFDEHLTRTHELLGKRDGEGAEEAARSAWKEAANKLGPRDWRVAIAIDRLAMARYLSGDAASAAEFFERALDIACEYEESRPLLHAEIAEHVKLCRDETEF